MVAIVAIVAAVAIVMVLILDRRRNIEALERLDEKISKYGILRIRLATQVLVTYGSSLPAEDMLRMRRILQRHESVDGDEAERRWERRWVPEMRRMMDTLSGAVDGSDRDTFEDVAHAVEANEGMLAEARGIRAAILSRPSMVGYGRHRDGVAEGETH